MKDRIQSDYITAFKEKDMLTKNVLSLVKGEIVNQEINKKSELTDDEIINIIEKQIKLRKDGISEFEKAGREDLANQYNEEVSVLEKYMPTKLTPEEIDSIIEEAFNTIKPEGAKDFGLIMKEVTPKLKGRADIKEVSNLIRSRLS